MDTRLASKSHDRKVIHQIFEDIRRQEIAEKRDASLGQWASLTITVIAMLVLFLLFCVSISHAQIIQPAEIDFQKIAMIESSGNPLAWRKADDSRGLYQITPIVLKEWNNFHPAKKYAMNDLWNPKVNFEIASWYMNKRIPQMLKHFKVADTVKNRIFAYNAGIGNVVKGRMPKITKLYIEKYYR